MAAYFLDSSALVKRYVVEIGSVWINSLLRPQSRNDYCVARLTAVEVASAIVRRGRGGTVTPQQVAAALPQLRLDFRMRFDKLSITARLIDQAITLAVQHALRGYDAIQLAAALHFNRRRRRDQLPPLTFVSADTNLNNAAATEGLAVDDPNAHP